MVGRINGLIYRWNDGCMDGWMEERNDELADGGTDSYIDR